MTRAINIFTRKDIDFIVKQALNNEIKFLYTVLNNLREELGILKDEIAVLTKIVDMKV